MLVWGWSKKAPKHVAILRCRWLYMLLCYDGINHWVLFRVFSVNCHHSTSCCDIYIYIYIYIYQSKIKLLVSYVAYHNASCHHNKNFGTKFQKSASLTHRYLDLESSCSFMYKTRVYISAIKYKLCLSGLCAGIVCSNAMRATLLSLALLFETEKFHIIIIIIKFWSKKLLITHV